MTKIYDKEQWRKRRDEKLKKACVTSTGRGSSQLVVLKGTCLPLPQSKRPCLTQFSWRTRTRKMNPGWCNSCIASVCVCVQVSEVSPDVTAIKVIASEVTVDEVTCNRRCLAGLPLVLFPSCDFPIFGTHPCLAYRRCSISACWMSHWVLTLTPAESFVTWNHYTRNERAQSRFVSCL